MHTDFESNEVGKGGFCMKLAGYILKYNADYLNEMNKAKTGNCSYRNECPIYAKTTKKNVQLKLAL